VVEYLLGTIIKKIIKKLCVHVGPVKDLKIKGLHCEYSNKPLVILWFAMYSIARVTNLTKCASG